MNESEIRETHERMGELMINLKFVRQEMTNLRMNLSMLKCAHDEMKREYEALDLALAHHDGRIKKVSKSGPTTKAPKEDVETLLKSVGKMPPEKLADLFAKLQESIKGGK